MVKIEDINNLKIIEYTTTIIHESRTWKIWVNKRINPAKEFYDHWQTPGGHIEKTDITIKHAAQREIREETGILIPMNELGYCGTENYLKGNEWRRVHCFRTSTRKVPTLTEPLEMTNWELKEMTEVLRGKTIDSLRDTLTKGSRNNTTVILIDGTCGAGKSTLTEITEKYLQQKGFIVKKLDESFIIQDPKKRMETYGKAIEKWKNKGGIENEKSLRKIAKEFEIWIRDNWMKQIYDCFTSEIDYEVILMDRNLFSTEIFMHNMISQQFIYPQDLEEISKNYDQWEFLKRDSLVIWWNTSQQESIKRLQNRNRTGETDISYYKELHTNYAEWMTKIYPNLKIISKETTIPKEQLKEFIPEIINEKEIYYRTRPYYE